jgi:hypothetical protein
LLHPIPLESLLPMTGGHDVPGRADSVFSIQWVRILDFSIFPVGGPSH